MKKIGIISAILMNFYSFSVMAEENNLIGIDTLTSLGYNSYKFDDNKLLNDSSFEYGGSAKMSVILSTDIFSKNILPAVGFGLNATFVNANGSSKDSDVGVDLSKYEIDSKYYFFNIGAKFKYFDKLNFFSFLTIGNAYRELFKLYLKTSNGNYSLGTFELNVKKDYYVGFDFIGNYQFDTGITLGLGASIYRHFITTTSYDYYNIYGLYNNTIQSTSNLNLYDTGMYLIFGYNF
ncbi:hypothetical protein QEJ31_14860 [Pigmentibacter sp. JX0631]|uniref:hypothetical protein n=1 Tax=Pigmentibacter sp. JX0631 TaxID=2976982 RepID=UPI002468402A|nr:hypothetical protein [Pigmentibacter sp. JX0631]WGL59809.1 hypothetical protein QEJ31_14860 [Pigmentibacter sp. JX0631]